MQPRDAIRPYLDLEARVDDEEQSSDDEQEDAAEFINDNEDDDAGRPVNYNTINAALETEGRDDNLPTLEEALVRYGRNEAGPSSRTLDDFREEDGDDDGDVWVVKCKRKRERNVLQHIEKAPMSFRNLIKTSYTPFSGCGYLYLRTTDHGTTSKMLRGCSVVVRKPSGPNGIDMAVVLDPVEIVFCRQPNVAAAIHRRDAAKSGPFPGTWVRLGRAEAKRKRRKPVQDDGRKRKATESSQEDAGKMKKRKGSDGKERQPDGQQEDEGKSDEDENGRSHSFEPETPEVIPLYTNDPAFVVEREGDNVVVAFLARVPQSSLDNNLDSRQRYVQSLVATDFTPLPESQLQMVFGKSYPSFKIDDGLLVKTIHVKDVRPLGKYPNSTEGRLFLASRNPNVRANFPHIDDWRFDIGDMVVSVLTGEEGVVCEQTLNGPIVQQRTETAREGHHSLGWAIKKRWFVGDYVCHISGVSGIVVAVNDQKDEVTIQDMSENLDYDFVGHLNCFRSTQRNPNAVGYDMARKDSSRIPSWIEAAKFGPSAIRNDKDFFQFREEWSNRLRLNRVRQQVFLMSHKEATQKIREMKTGQIPWKGREVLVTGEGIHHGLQACVVNVHIRQDTQSGLKLLIESAVQGQHGARHLVDYSKVVDRFWELPLHILDRPLHPIFIPPLTYVHPMTFRVKSFTTTRPKFTRSGTPLPTGEIEQGDPAFSVDDADSEPAFSWPTILRHPSQSWLFNAKGIEALRFKVLLTATIGTKVFKERKSQIRMVYEENAVTALVQYMRRERAIPSNAEIHPVHPLSTTTEPIFIFDGPFTNTVVVRASTVKYENNVNKLVGFTVDLNKLEVDFESKVEFLATEACVLAVDYKEVTQVLQRVVNNWRKSQDKALQTRRK